MKKLMAMVFLAMLIFSGCSSNDAQEPPKETKKLPAPMAEIMDKVDDKENGATINFTNGWKFSNADEDRIIYVEVGSLKADPKQGVALILRKKKDGSLMTKTEHLSPSKNGPLTVEKFNGTNLELKAADGTMFRFNAFDGFR